jgi:hypothetical protein
MDLSISSKTTWILKPIPTLIIKDETLYHEIQKGEEKKKEFHTNISTAVRN